MDLLPQTEQYLDDLVDAELARRRFGDFCERMDPSYVAYPHSRAIVEHLEALERRDIDKLMIFMPPQNGKTYHASERFPAWYLGRNPRHWVGIVSYTADRAESSSIVARDLIADVERWPFPDVHHGAQTAAGRWSTNKGGVVSAVGIGGSLTGFGAHLLAIDDPVKDAAQADSPVWRDRAWNWYTQVARTRARRPFAQLIAQTRWNQDDLSGRILESKGGSEWTVLRLPAIALNNDPLGRQPGEILWPQGPPLPSIDKGEISSRAFQALYQGDPQPDAGTIFRREWFGQTYFDLPTSDVTLVQSVDGAWTEGVSSSFSCIATWATDGIDYFLIDVWRARVEYPQLKANLLAQNRTYDPDYTIVEKAASGMAIIQELKRESGITIIGEVARGSKESRAEAVTPLFESGKVKLPANPSFDLNAWIDEHLRFPTGANNDQVDTTSLALSRLKRGGGRTWGKVDTSKRAR